MNDIYTIKCPLHRKEVVLFTCTHVQCLKTATVCAACPDVHEDHKSELINFGEWVQRVSKNVQEGAKYQTFLKDSMTDQLLKWCDDDEMHLKKVEQHCQAQKMLISQDISEARDLFSEKCNLIQSNMDALLEDFLAKYREQFRQCKQTIEDSYLLYRRFSAYQNPNNLIFRLQQSTSREANEVTQGLKRMSARVRQIDADRSGFTEGLRLLSQRVTDMTYNLPVFEFTQGLDVVCQTLAEELLTHFKSKLSIKTPQVINKPASSPLKENKIASQTKPIQKQADVQKPNMQDQHVISLTNKSLHINGTSSLNPQELTFKPLKKYQLDFNVSAIEVVSDTLFALVCSTDSYMRVFDTVQKKIHTLQAHATQITCIQKWVDCASGALSNNLAAINQGKYQPKFTYLFTLSSDAAIIWTFELSTSSSTHNLANVPHIFHKYVFPIAGMVTQICALQDNSCFFMGDKEGGIEVYNYQTKRIQQACMRGKHTKAVTSIQMFKKFDKVLVASADQSISVWRLLYNTHNTSFENAYCDQIIQVNQGGIHNISLVSSNPNYIILTTQEGSISLLNLVTQSVTLSSEHQSMIVDYLVAEDLSQKQKGHTLFHIVGEYESFCTIAFSVASRSLRVWRVTHKEDGWVQSESKVDIAITPSDSQMGPKMQFVHMPSSVHPLVLIANESNKELLVYEVVTK